MEGINVLSLFDGMSCGQQALERAGFKVNNYFASEIDKYAIKVTMNNYPNTKQLGSVVNVDGYSLPKIDILIGGSPCQSFSFAGKRKGMSTKDEQEILTLEHYLQLKADGFEFEGQSYLFWEYMRLLNEIRTKNPNVYFLLENVEMGEKWEKVLSKAIGVNGIHINSALVSAQNRKRIYWTNIGMKPSGLFGDLESIIEQPKDKGILLKDVLENEVDEKYFLSEKVQERFKEYKTNSNIIGTTAPEFRTIGQRDEVYGEDGKIGCLNATDYKQPKQIITYGNSRLNDTIEKHYENLENGTLIDSYNKEIHKNKSVTINTRVSASNCTHIIHNNTNAIEIIGLNENQLKKFNTNVNADKANTITLAQGRAGSSEEYMDAVSKIAKLTSNIRKLTPIECERLQTVKDNYTASVSDSQRYKMLGNGWTVDVIAHILSYMD